MECFTRWPQGHVRDNRGYLNRGHLQGVWWAYGQMPTLFYEITGHRRSWRVRDSTYGMRHTVCRGHFGNIPIGLRAFLWRRTTIYVLKIIIQPSCRSHSWFLATWAFDITSICFWSMNNIMNNILAPLSKHMIYAGICITLNLIEKIGYFSSWWKIFTISFLSYFRFFSDN